MDAPFEKDVMAEELEIEIGPTGQVTVRTIGIKGSKCLDVSDFIAKIVGKELSRELTREYYEVEQHVEQHQAIRHEN